MGGGGAFFLAGGGLPASGGLQTFWQSVVRMHVMRQRPEPHCVLSSQGSHSFGGALRGAGKQWYWCQWQHEQAFQHGRMQAQVQL